MRVLFVSRTHSDQKDDAYNHRMLMLQDGLQRLGMETDFLYLGNWIPYQGGNWIRRMMGNHVRRLPPLVFPLQMPGLLGRLNSYDVIHAGTAMAAFPFCFFKKKLRPQLIHDMHGDLCGEMYMKWRYEKSGIGNTFHLLEFPLLVEVAIHCSDYHVIVSRALERQLRARHFAKERTLLLRNGVDINLFQPSGSCSANGAFKVCYAGDTQPWQCIDLFVEAARLLPDDDMQFRFIGFRQTPRDNQWKRIIHQHLGSRAELYDRMPQHQLIPLLQDADLLVLPRRSHLATVAAFPTKFAEYLALGKPVVVSNVDDTAKMVAEHDCGLVSSSTPSGLAETIRKAKDMGSKRLRNMGERGRHFAENTFSWEVICKDYYHFLATTVIERSF